MLYLSPVQVDNFYPRAPGGARRPMMSTLALRYVFLSACPGRGTTMSCVVYGSIEKFLSACPGRGTTLPSVRPHEQRDISIRVPREGHDGRAHGPYRPAGHFYPRAPGGARLSALSGAGQTEIFLSACPGRGTTGQAQRLRCRNPNFYPRAPGGARPRRALPAAASRKFLSACPGRGTTGGHVFTSIRA